MNGSSSSSIRSLLPRMVRNGTVRWCQKYCTIMPTQETCFCKQLFVKIILPKGNARTAVSIRNTWPQTHTKRLFPMSYSSVCKKKLPAELKSSEHSLHNNCITRLQGKWCVPFVASIINAKPLTLESCGYVRPTTEKGKSTVPPKQCPSRC